MHHATIVISLLLSICVLNTNAQTWRSSLYPENWVPGYSDIAGRFLHDFSYAGYGNGLKPIPDISSPVVNITQAPYYADNTGVTDVTNILQQAINNLPATGGVIYLPAGEYRLSVPENRVYGILVNKNNVVIRGAGAGITKIKNMSVFMRSKKLFYFCADAADWRYNVSSESRIVEDIALPTHEVKVENSDLYVKGDWVVLRNEATPEFIDEHYATGYWTTEGVRGIYFCRQILGVNAYTNTLIIDIPTRYPLKTRDNARVYKLKAQLMECGMEDLSIGNVEHQGTGFLESDYLVAGTAAYDVHDSHLITVRNAINCWFRRIHTYRPEENTGDFHTVSNCFQLYHVRNVTVEDCDFRRSQYEGGGGNGYMYILQGNDCLLKNCHAEHSRHNYSFKQMSANGNVVYNCTSKDPYLATDFHMHLSMANLFDNFNADADIIDAGFRTAGLDGAKHMYTTTESVMWNTKSINRYGTRTYVINSRQFGNGYNIGTSGVATGVNTTSVIGTSSGIPFNTSPIDLTEGLGQGTTLRPVSLYLDQLEKRVKRPEVAPVLPLLNVDFENYLLNERYNYAGNRFVSYGTSVTSKIVENPNKSGINTSDKVLRIERSANTSVSPTAVTNRGVLTDSYDLTMNDEYSILEMKVLKETSGRLAARLSTDYNSEISSVEMTGSPDWQTVKLDFRQKIDWSLRNDARLIIQMEKNSSPETFQTDPLVVYIDDVKLVSRYDVSTNKSIFPNHRLKVTYIGQEKEIKIENPDMIQTSVYLYDLPGKEILRRDSHETAFNINLSTLKSGAYLLLSRNNHTILSSEKIIIK